MLRGGCYCRTVRYEIDATPRQQTACHCTICRHTSGAPFVGWMTVPAGSFRFVSDEPERFKSSEHATRTFCRDCGTPLTFQSAQHAGDLDVTTSSLDEPEQVPPRDHTFTRSKLSWVKLAAGLPTFPATRTGGA
ncbi:GFA family protein [soil metagenome]